MAGGHDLDAAVGVTDGDGSGCISSMYSQIGPLSASIRPFIFRTGTLPAGLRRRKSGSGSRLAQTA